MRKKIVFWLLFAAIMSLSFKISQDRSLSMRFVDEEDHITIASFINKNLKLYQEIQSNHQPIVYYASATLQKLIQPDNIFMLVRRHRQAMFFYGAFWSLLIAWRFRTVGLIFVMFFEFLKYYLFGNLWLMESFAVYPSVYLLGISLKIWLENFQPKIPEWIFLGFSSFLIIFNLVPLWPWLATIWFLILIKVKQKIILPGLTLLIITIIFFNPTHSFKDWFIRTIYNNFVYAIPDLSPFKQPTDYLKIIFFPFLAFFNFKSLQAQFIALFFTGYLIALIKKPKLIIIYPLLALINNRVLSPSMVYYQGFHLLPWLGLLIFSFGYSLKTIKYRFLFIWVIWAGILMLNKNMPYFWKTNPTEEYYINYSYFDDLNWAIKTINSNSAKTRAAIFSNEILIQWNNGSFPATKQVVYYPWEKKIPDLKKDYDKVFNLTNPNLPEFIYGPTDKELAQAKYKLLKRDGKETELLIRNDIFQNISQEQWHILASRRFSP